MDTRRLARIDMNLLVAFQVLLEEQNVSRAAERLFITQSAMSKTLSRLRELFDDALFTRSAHGMVPTPRAVELHASLEDILLNLDGMIGHTENDPQNFSGRFNISALDQFVLPLVPKLVGRFLQEAPELSVKISQDIETQFKGMAEGRVDCAIGGRRVSYDDDIVVDVLCSTKPVFLMRKDHPLKELEEATWRDIMQYPEVVIKMPSTEYMRGSWIQSRFMRYMKLTTIVLETPDYLTALQTLAETDAILLSPRLSLEFVKATGVISSMPVPGKEGRGSVDVVLTYHKRTANSPMHRWVREQISDIYSYQQQWFEQREADRVSAAANGLIGEE